MKIRIGNDIKLNVYLSKKNIPDTVNIKSIRCVLVNTNTDQCCQCPSTAYDINGCGLPKYHILGHCHPNVCNNRLRGIFVYYRNCWKKKCVDCCNYFRYSGYVSTVRSSSDFL